jgi:hypothetical protein
LNKDTVFRQPLIIFFARQLPERFHKIYHSTIENQGADSSRVLFYKVVPTIDCVKNVTFAFKPRHLAAIKNSVKDDCKKGIKSKKNRRIDMTGLNINPIKGHFINLIVIF